MLRFQWNALQPGQLVRTHDPASPEMALIPGTVVMTEPHLGPRGINGVGIRVAGDDGTTRVVRPSYRAVHVDPIDPTEPCWRCDEIAAAAPALRQCGRCRGMFPGDRTLPPGLDTGWWACPPCRDLLIGPGAMAVPTRKSKAATATR